MLDPQTSRFWKASLQSGLMDAQGLMACWEAISPAKREFPEHIDRRLARQAVQSKALTLWQAQQLLAGRTSGYKVDRYVLLDLIGQGGMGRVYLARDTRLNRRVALKILSPERVSNPRAIARFQREARVGAQLQHENLVRIYDFGESNGRHYLVMEYIEGKTIGTLISEQGQIPPASSVRLARQVALGLEHAHRKGLIHRDVNPYNVLVTRDGTAKLADLGLAMDLADEDHVTREGATVGTFDYVAPEQARHSHSADIRSDIYSLGCTIYHMCSGQVPFPSPSLPEKLFAHQAMDPAPLDQVVPGLPKGIAEVVQRMMRKSPDDRYATPMDVVEALEPFAEEPAVFSNRQGGPALVEKAGAELSPRSPQPGDAKTAPAHQDRAEPVRALVKTVAVPDGAEPSLLTATKTGSGANVGKPSASLVSPGSDHLASDADFPLFLDLGPEPSLSEGLARSKPRSSTEFLASAAYAAAPVRWLASYWLSALVALAVIVTVLAVILAAGSRRGNIRDRPVEGPPRRSSEDAKFQENVIVREGEYAQEFSAQKLFEAMQTAIGRGGAVELRNRTPLRLTSDQAIDLMSGQGQLIVRAAPESRPIIEIELKDSRPLLTTGSGISLELSGLTVVVRYPEQGASSPTPPPVIKAAGVAKIDRCAFKVVGGSRRNESSAIRSDGGALTIDRCWFQGFDKAIDVDAMNMTPARILRTMIVAAPGSIPAQTQSPEWFGWGVKLQLHPGGGAQKETPEPHLILGHCTFEGAGLLDLTSNSAKAPLLVDVNHCAVRAQALLACKQGDRLPVGQIVWRGEANQYDILGRSWIVLAASQGTPVPLSNITDLDSWLQFAQNESSPIRAKLRFEIDPDARSERPQPRDFAIMPPRPPLTKPGANPDLVGP